MKQQEQMPLAYSGKYIDYKSKTYFLAPEKSQGGCMGCAFIGSGKCPQRAVTYCCSNGGNILVKAN